MSDIRPESIEDPEVPTEDALEQHQLLPGEDEEPEDFELPDDANVADAVEQHQAAGGENEDEHR